MSDFFTADWHLGDYRFFKDTYINRPFADPQQMAEQLLLNHNKLVQPEDTVYLLGDIIYSKGDCPLDILGEFNGQLVLLKGNHDLFSDKEYAPYISEILPEGQGLQMDIEGIPCWLTHYPTASKAEYFNLVAHVHGHWKVQKNMLNVGVDVHHYKPLPSEHIKMYYKNIHVYCDDDIWAYKHPANLTHEQRGRKGSYWK